MKNSKKLLYFGSLIYLTFVDDDNNKFLAFSEGFNKVKVRMKTINQMNNESNITKGLFQLYPSFYHTEYIKTK